MVTIKKTIEKGETSPTITITLKGSTPDQEKLFSTLMNSQPDNTKDKPTNKSKKNKKQPNTPQQKVEQLVQLQVLRKETGTSKSNNPTDKEVKLSFTVNNKPVENSSYNKNADIEKMKTQTKTENVKRKDTELPFLKLPPGITITKIDGSSSNSKNNYRISMNEVHGSGNVPVNNKSGVIVVDTEKLINSTESNKESSRKSKKKKNKKQQPASEFFFFKKY